MQDSDGIKTSTQAGWNWDHSYANLPGLMFSKVFPTHVAQPALVVFNENLVASLGLNPESLKNEAGVFAGNKIPEGADPIAQAYAGHQFGHFTNLGDGRAIVLGEHLTPKGERFDVQLKGPGRTPYSRGGDGRAVLGPMLREYLISEAMHALGIPTTRSLAVATTGESVVRVEILPGAVLTRIAASHIRVGTFQYAAAHDDPTLLLSLADYTLIRHFPKLADSENRYLKFFEAVMDRQASLIASWLHVGFIHGVMNTDNMALSGETIDYGPCAFIDDYDPDAVFSSIDRHGRYAYAKQPEIARWNLARLAEALLPLFHQDEETAADFANAALKSFECRFQKCWLAGMRAKLGLFSEENDDAALAQSLLNWMQANYMDFTNTFRSLSHDSAIVDPPFIDAGFLDWHSNWIARLSRQHQSTSKATEQMRGHNPSVIPRNHQVEAALKAAENGDLAVFEKLLTILNHPYSEDVPIKFTRPPAPGGPRYQTYCGT